MDGLIGVKLLMEKIKQLLKTKEYDFLNYAPGIDDDLGVNEIVLIAQKYGLKTCVNYPNYCGLKGLTFEYQKTFGKPNVIQMEIKKEWRDFFNNSDKVQNITIPFLTEVIHLYKKM